MTPILRKLQKIHTPSSWFRRDQCNIYSSISSISITLAHVFFLYLVLTVPPSFYPKAYGCLSSLNNGKLFDLSRR